MPQFNIPVRMEVPAHGEVEVEAETLEEACIRLRDDIQANGIITIADEPEFATQWQDAHSLGLADVMLPDGRVFSG